MSSRSLVPRVLLGLLEREPAYGYTLKQRYDDMFPTQRPLAYGQVYATLSRLERDGLARVLDIESGEGPLRTRYAITGDGSAQLDSWIRTPDRAAGPGHTTIFVRATLAMLSSRSPHAVLDTQRGVHLARMRELTADRAQATEHRRIAIDYEIAHLDADLRWMEETAARLEHHPAKQNNPT